MKTKSTPTTTSAKNENDENVCLCRVRRSSSLVFSTSRKFIHSFYPVFVVLVSMSLTEIAVMRNAAHIPAAVQCRGSSHDCRLAKNHLFAQCTQRKLHFEVFSFFFFAAESQKKKKKTKAAYCGTGCASVSGGVQAICVLH